MRFGSDHHLGSSENCAVGLELQAIRYSGLTALGVCALPRLLRVRQTLIIIPEIATHHTASVREARSVLLQNLSTLDDIRPPIHAPSGFSCRAASF